MHRSHLVDIRQHVLIPPKAKRKPNKEIKSQVAIVISCVVGGVLGGAMVIWLTGGLL